MDSGQEMGSTKESIRVEGADRKQELLRRVMRLTFDIVRHWHFTIKLNEERCPRLWGDFND